MRTSKKFNSKSVQVLSAVAVVGAVGAATVISAENAKADTTSVTYDGAGRNYYLPYDQAAYDQAVDNYELTKMQVDSLNNRIADLKDQFATIKDLANEAKNQGVNVDKGVTRQLDSSLSLKEAQDKISSWEKDFQEVLKNLQVAIAEAKKFNQDKESYKLLQAAVENYNNQLAIKAAEAQANGVRITQSTVQTKAESLEDAEKFYKEQLKKISDALSDTISYDVSAKDINRVNQSIITEAKSTASTLTEKDANYNIQITYKTKSGGNVLITDANGDGSFQDDLQKFLDEENASIARQKAAIEQEIANYKKSVADLMNSGVPNVSANQEKNKTIQTKLLNDISDELDKTISLAQQTNVVTDEVKQAGKAAQDIADSIKAYLKDAGLNPTIIDQSLQNNLVALNLDPNDYRSVTPEDNVIDLGMKATQKDIDDVNKKITEVSANQNKVIADNQQSYKDAQQEVVRIDGQLKDYQNQANSYKSRLEDYKAKAIQFSIDYQQFMDERDLYNILKDFSSDMNQSTKSLLNALDSTASTIDLNNAKNNLTTLRQKLKNYQTALANFSKKTAGGVSRNYDLQKAYAKELTNTLNEFQKFTDDYNQYINETILYKSLNDVKSKIDVAKANAATLNSNFTQSTINNAKTYKNELNSLISTYKGILSSLPADVDKNSGNIKAFAAYLAKAETYNNEYSKYLSDNESYWKFYDYDYRTNVSSKLVEKNVIAELVNGKGPTGSSHSGDPSPGEIRDSYIRFDKKVGNVYYFNFNLRDYISVPSKGEDGYADVSGILSVTFNSNNTANIHISGGLSGQVGTGTVESVIIGQDVTVSSSNGNIQSALLGYLSYGASGLGSFDLLSYDYKLTFSEVHNTPPNPASIPGFNGTLTKPSKINLPPFTLTSPTPPKYNLPDAVLPDEVFVNEITAENLELMDIKGEARPPAYKAEIEVKQAIPVSPSEKDFVYETLTSLPDDLEDLFVDYYDINGFFETYVPKSTTLNPDDTSSTALTLKKFVNLTDKSVGVDSVGVQALQITKFVNLKSIEVDALDSVGSQAVEISKNQTLNPIVMPVMNDGGSQALEVTKTVNLSSDSSSDNDSSQALEIEKFIKLQSGISQNLKDLASHALDVSKKVEL